MLGTGRGPRSRAGTHLAGALAALLVGASVAMVFAGDAVGAAGRPRGRTVTVTFTDDGPSPPSVELSVGDSVRFVNNLSQTGQVTVAGVTTQVTGAGVTVHGAAAADIDLPELGDSGKVRYRRPQTVDYTATYTLSLLPVPDAFGANLAPATTTTSTAGRIEVTAAPGSPSDGDSQQTDSPPPGSASTGSGGHPGQDGAAATGPGQGSTTPQAGAGRSGGLPYQAPGASVAAQAVPPRSGGPAPPARPPTPPRPHPRPP